MNTRAGQHPLPEDLIDVDAVIGAYYVIQPDLDNPDHHVSFGTSGHRGRSQVGSFNQAHIIATTAAIVDYRKHAGIDGPLFLGKDTHALSAPAILTALEVLAAAEVTTVIDSRGGYTPTPAVSHAILRHNQDSRGIVRLQGRDLADGIVVTPSHNPPADGGFKYNPPQAGPADTDITTWIADRANHYLRTGVDAIARHPDPHTAPTVHRYDFLGAYVDDLPAVIDMQAIAAAGVKIGADPLGGAAVAYWAEIAERHRLDLTLINDTVDPTFSFIPLDWDGQIRMDCSSEYAMTAVLTAMTQETGSYDVAIGNDADADRHGIITREGGLLNPNHYLAVATDYLFRHRHQWPQHAGVGKTLVSSGLIDRVSNDLGRELVEVPVGFKWFVPGLLNGTLGIGGEESAGASFLRRDGRVWTTDKDGIIMGLLAAEIAAVTGKSPSAYHTDLAAKHGHSWYTRIDASATREQKQALANLSTQAVQATDVAGEKIVDKLTTAPGNEAPIGGLKVVTDHAWFAARPSGTEDVYKIYAESFISADHLNDVVQEARGVVNASL